MSTVGLAPLDVVADRLETADLLQSRRGDSLTARCPVHEDRTASLSVGTGHDGRALIHCHAGCPTVDVLDALGLELRDLFVDSGKPWTAAAFRRTGASLERDGRVRMGVARYMPDAPEGTPKTLAAKGSARDLWPDPTTMAGPLLFVVEGEPDAVTAAALDLPAVAVPGVGKWDNGWGARIAAGRDRVVVIADGDAPGRVAAHRTAAAIAEHCPDVRVVDLEPRRSDGFDLSDFAADAATDAERRQARELLLQVAEMAPRQGGAPILETGQLLDAILGAIGRYVVLPDDHAAVVLALFVAHTHAVKAAHATPYLIVLSPERRSGKTLLLEVLELLVARAWRIVAASEAAMFRKIAQDRPTLLLDEIDAIFGSATERTEPLRALLNAGNRPGSCVARCVGQHDQKVVDFDVFCPKILAGIDTGRLPDTIRDRGVELRMKRKTSAERVERFRVRRATPAAEALRSQLSAWGDREGDTLRDLEPELPEALNDRAAEAWEPLLAIADLAGDDWPARSRAAALALAQGAEADEASYGTRLLTKFAEIVGDRSSVATDEVLDQVNSDEELPFGGWRDGRGLDARALARLLKPYGLRPRTIRLDGDTAKGYRRDEAAEEAFARYLPSATPSEASPPTQASHADDPTLHIPHPERDVTDVTDVTDASAWADGDGTGGVTP